MEQLRKENEHLRNEVEQLRERIKELEALLKQNSRNSSRPPSRDQSRKKKKGSKKGGGRKAGGQNGHEGHTLDMNEKPDEVQTHRPDCCAGCGEGLSEDAEVSEVEKRQVLELPPLQFITVEHQAERVRCGGCGHETAGQFPEGVTQPVQYGESVKRFGVYLKVEQFRLYRK